MRGKQSNPLRVVLILGLIAAAHDSLASDEEKNVCAEQSDQGDWAYLKVTASQKKVGYQHESTRTIEADVYLNGVKVGKTPYEDCLPKGVYKVEIRMGDLSPYVQKLMAKPGDTLLVKGEFVVPMPAVEWIRLEKEKAQEMEKKRNEERQREQKEKREMWQAELNAWESEAAPIRERRKPYLKYGTIFLLSGAGLLIAGGVLEGNAISYHNKAEDTHDLWLNSDDSLEQELMDEIEDYQEKRNLYHAFGISSLAIGGAAVATAVVFYTLVPSLPEKPKKPEGIIISNPKVSLQFIPIATGDLLGGNFRIAF